ncbi:PREDICTED: uncharacterized protein LOC109590699, partial [Amphimedon queenslandica]|uniref:J domain-containing protein n=1 Tax=Amphimedon queenslandica TaxID=400682 RepID=A0AAN0JYF7_AMPQE
MATGYSNTEGQQLLDVAPIESDYYKLLQVEKNASKAEIKVAYHKMSRMYHPDKTQDSKTEEMMKRLNEAKSVLLDEVQRAEYDEKHEDETIYDPKGFLPTGIRFSDFFLKDFNKFKADFKAGKIQVPRQKFERLLQRKVGDALRKAEIYKNDKIRQIAKSNTPTPLLNILQASNALLEEDPNVIANAYKIQQMLLGIQSNGVYSAPPSEDGIKVLCLDSLSDKEILLLYSLLLNEECSSTSDMRHCLNVLIPKTTMLKSITTAATETQGKKCANCNKSLLFSMLIKKRSYISNACYYCRKPFCSNCQPRSISYSRLGLTEKQPFCKDCNTILGNLDAEDWMRMCLQYLEQGTINSTKTALGCLTMALLSSSDKIKPVLDVAKGFLHNGLPELAMPLLASVMKESVAFKTLVQRQTLTASVLTALAEKPDAQWEE